MEINTWVSGSMVKCMDLANSSGLMSIGTPVLILKTYDPDMVSSYGLITANIMVFGLMTFSMELVFTDLELCLMTKSSMQNGVKV